MACYSLKAALMGRQGKRYLFPKYVKTVQQWLCPISKAIVMDMVSPLYLYIQHRSNKQ